VRNSFVIVGLAATAGVCCLGCWRGPGLAIACASGGGSTARGHVSCQTQLAVIEVAKKQWAMANGAGVGQVVTWDDLLEFMGGHKIPVCPRGGEYRLGRVGEEPYCTECGAMPAGYTRCEWNILEIEKAKRRRVSALQNTNGQMLTMSELLAYLPVQREPLCPFGGRYVLGGLGDDRAACTQCGTIRSEEALACVNNCKNIYLAKMRWATANSATNGQAVSRDNLLEFLPHGRMPECPVGGRYELNRIGQPVCCPKCGWCFGPSGAILLRHWRENGVGP